MIYKLFEKISDKISFTFAVALFTTFWSWMASFYGFYFVYTTVSMSEYDLKIILINVIWSTLLAILIHFIHYGLLFKFGFPGFTKSIKLINKYLHKEKIFFHYSHIEYDKIEKLYKAIVYLPVHNLLTAFFYSSLVVTFYVIIYFVYLGHEINLNTLPELIYLIAGGGISALIICYFTFSITEYLTGPSKSKIEELLFRLNKNHERRHLLSYKYKLFFALILILMNMSILVIIIKSSEKSMFVTFFFILISIIEVGILIFLMINTMNLSLTGINMATKDLAAGGMGLYFPAFSDKELVQFSKNYNNAALEIFKIRADLAKNVAERTRELGDAYDKLNSLYNQTQADLLLGRRIQKSILPDKNIEYSNIKVTIKYKPMIEVGGDIYDIVELKNGFYRIFLADAAGHGVQAALVTMIIKSEYEKLKNIENIGKLLELFNNNFINLYESLGMFFSCIVMDIDISNNRIYYSSAGHPDQIYISGKKFIKLSHTGKLIGILNDAEYMVENLELNKNGKLFLFTDGLFEQFNHKDEAFGEEKIYKILEKNSTLEIPDIMKKVENRLKKFIGDDNKISKDDDITFIGISFSN